MSLHLVADDLTGALDSAGSFGTPEAPVRVSWSDPRAPDFGDFAFSTETRDGTAAVALKRAMAAAEAVVAAPGGTLIFKKIDSLLRGHPIAELAALARRLRPDRIVIAPAHPALGRITRNGRQHARGTDGWDLLTCDLPAELLAHGFDAATRNDLVIADAVTEDDLVATVQREQAHGGRILWCGSGGLAQALAGGRRPYLPVPAGRTLGLIGTDHDVTAAQVDAVDKHAAGAVLAWRGGDEPEEIAGRLERRLDGGHAVLLVPNITPISRQKAAAAIATMLKRLLPTLQRPDLLFCSGGETLRVVCDALGADGLGCEGFVADGVPLSRLSGGRWPQLPVLSKSGAFGPPETLIDLLQIPTDKAENAP